MKRRDFLKSTAGIAGTGLLTGHQSSAHSNTEEPNSGSKPNILFILVDELRYPTVFPGDVKTPGEFLATYMPNLHKLWQKGVKFGNHHTAANACTPARGTLISGLYSQQSWLCTTILSSPYPEPTQPGQPVLNAAFPTYGKLLAAAGYKTPYVGKWHVSIPTDEPDTLDNYGFQYYESYYDNTGTNLQGTYGDESRGYHNDAHVVTKAIKWLNQERPADQPWCLTVSLVNPHDREFFPAGTEFQTYADLLANKTLNPTQLPPVAPYPGNGPVVAWEKDELKSPKSYGYPALPPNWENAQSIASKNLKLQTLLREFSQAVWGGVTDDPAQDTATVERYPSPRPLVRYAVSKMPFNYWQRGLDSYTQIMGVVDRQIGRVLEALSDLPQSVIDNTVIVFASDHGEYSGAHGFVQGKLGTAYEEAWHIPLVVVDPTHRFTGDIERIRTGLTSSVDFSSMLVSFAYNGTRNWMTGDLAEIYGNRHDLIPMLRSAKAPGRDYVLFATDEIMPNYFNFNNAPTHLMGLRTNDTKLGFYAKWIPVTSKIINSSIELEFYDYSTSGGQLELDSRPDDPRVGGMVNELLNNLVPNELQQVLPGSLKSVQQQEKIAHLIYRELIALYPAQVWQNGGLQTLLGYGVEF
jgi:uncharacterized sulfatase